MALATIRGNESTFGKQEKRGNYEITPALQQSLIAVNTGDRKTGLSGPTIQLSGHGGDVFGVDFSPDGNHLASSSFDNTILLWNVYGDCENYGTLKGHTNAVLECHWSYDGEKVYSCSADKSCAIWDATTGTRIKKLGHQAIVNSVNCSRKGTPLLCSGADDGTTKVWDCRIRRCVQTFEHPYQMLSVCFDDNNEKIFAGCLDNTVQVWDLRTNSDEALYTLQGHDDSVTGVALSPDGEKLMTNSMDNTCRLWDVRNFVEDDTKRELGILEGVSHNFEKNLLRCSWSPDGTMVAAGSSDRNVIIWDVTSKQLKYALPGHIGSVNSVVFHPKEDIIASASSDKTIYLGELS